MGSTPSIGLSLMLAIRGPQPRKCWGLAACCAKTAQASETSRTPPDTPQAPTMPKNAALVRVENLYRYYDRRCAVQDLSFELGKGEILGLLGPNGAGKTSTLQMLSGNLAPSAGRIFIEGVDLLDEPQKAK